MRFESPLAALGVVVAIGAALLPSIVAAQDAGATISVEQAHPAGSSVHYIVRMVSDDGGDPVDGATVTATPTGPEADAVEASPVTLTPADEGRYEGSVEMPESGTWTVTFASSDPAASLEHTQEMPASAVDASGEANDSDSDASPVVPLVLAGVFLAALAALGVWTLVERRRPAESPPESSG